LHANVNLAFQLIAEESMAMLKSPRQGSAMKTFEDEVDSL
jgi:hypothetical protein